MPSNIRDVLILGSGPAGLTAAIYTARANLSPLVVQGPMLGGQLTTTTEVENYPGFRDGIMGPALMQQMREQAERFGAEVAYGICTKVDLSSRPFTLTFDDEREEKARTLIISTGASPSKLGLVGEDGFMGYGLSTCATCDGAFFRDKEIVVIGGGDSACEEALFLTRFGKRVRVIHRREEFRASKIMADRVLAHPKIEVLWNSRILELRGEPHKKLTGAKIENSKTHETSEIHCDAIFYAIGHIPNSSLFDGILKMDETGYLLTGPDSTKTNIAGVFACGDVRDHVYRQAVTAAGTGCMAALEAERFLSDDL